MKAHASTCFCGKKNVWLKFKYLHNLYASKTLSQFSFSVYLYPFSFSFFLFFFFFLIKLEYNIINLVSNSDTILVLVAVDFIFFLFLVTHCLVSLKVETRKKKWNSFVVKSSVEAFTHHQITNGYRSVRKRALSFCMLTSSTI